MWAANLIGGVILLFFGLVIRIFKLSGLIAGYNTASKKEKEKYDEEKLIKYVSNMFFAAAAVLLIGGFLSIFTSIPIYLISISWALFFIIILGGLVYMNIGNKVKK
jgi:Ca2+-dependent lipid-binding protein